MNNAKFKKHDIVVFKHIRSPVMEVICVEGDNYTVIWFAKGRYQELYVEEEYLTKVKTLPKKL